MYRLISFGSATLPTYDYDWDGGTPETLETLVRTVGGPSFDVYGTGDAPASMPYTVRYECVAVGATHAALRTALDALRALRGKRALLNRMPEDSPLVTQSAWARLLQISSRNTVQNQEMIWQPLTLIFQVLTPWKGTAHSEDFNLTAGGSTNCAVDNDGNAAVVDAVLTVTAGDAAITLLTVTISGLCKWAYDGSIAAGEALVVDSGAFSVLNDGDDAYADFALDSSNHATLEWLRLAPGTTTVAVAITGGGTGPTANFVYNDCWA